MASNLFNNYLKSENLLDNSMYTEEQLRTIEDRNRYDKQQELERALLAKQKRLEEQLNNRKMLTQETKTLKDINDGFTEVTNNTGEALQNQLSYLADNAVERDEETGMDFQRVLKPDGSGYMKVPYKGDTSVLYISQTPDGQYKIGKAADDVKPESGLNPFQARYTDQRNKDIFTNTRQGFDGTPNKDGVNPNDPNVMMIRAPKDLVDQTEFNIHRDIGMIQNKSINNVENKDFGSGKNEYYTQDAPLFNQDAKQDTEAFNSPAILEARRAPVTPSNLNINGTIKSKERLAIEKEIDNMGFIDRTLNTAKAGVGSFAKTFVLDTLDWLGEITNTFDLGTDQEKTETIDNLLGYNREVSNIKTEKVKQKLKYTLEAKDPFDKRALGGIAKDVITNPEVTAESLGYLAAMSLGLGKFTKAGKAINKASKIGDTAKRTKTLNAVNKSMTLADKTKLALARNTGVLNVSAGMTNNQIDDFKENNNGKEPTSAQVLGMYTMNLGINSVDKVVDTGILKSIFKPSIDSVKSMTKEEVKGIMPYIFGQSSKLLLSAPKEAVTEYIQTMGEEINKKLGTEKYGDSLKNLLTSDETVLEGLVGAAYGAGGVSHFTTAKVGTDAAVGSYNKTKEFVTGIGNTPDPATNTNTEATSRMTEEDITKVKENADFNNIKKEVESIYNIDGIKEVLKGTKDTMDTDNATEAVNKIDEAINKMNALASTAEDVDPAVSKAAGETVANYLLVKNRIKSAGKLNNSKFNNINKLKKETKDRLELSTDPVLTNALQAKLVILDYLKANNIHENKRINVNSKEKQPETTSVALKFLGGAVDGKERTGLIEYIDILTDPSISPQVRESVMHNASNFVSTQTAKYESFKVAEKEFNQQKGTKKPITFYGQDGVKYTYHNNSKAFVKKLGKENEALLNVMSKLMGEDKTNKAYEEGINKRSSTNAEDLPYLKGQDKSPFEEDTPKQKTNKAFNFAEEQDGEFDSYYKKAKDGEMYMDPLNESRAEVPSTNKKGKPTQTNQSISIGSTNNYLKAKEGEYYAPTDNVARAEVIGKTKPNIEDNYKADIDKLKAIHTDSIVYLLEKENKNDTDLDIKEAKKGIRDLTKFINEANKVKDKYINYEGNKNLISAIDKAVYIKDWAKSNIDKNKPKVEETKEVEVEETVKEDTDKVNNNLNTDDTPLKEMTVKVDRKYTKDIENLKSLSTENINDAAYAIEMGYKDFPKKEAKLAIRDLNKLITKANSIKERYKAYKTPDNFREVNEYLTKAEELKDALTSIIGDTPTKPNKVPTKPQPVKEEVDTTEEVDDVLEVLEEPKQEEVKVEDTKEVKVEETKDIEEEAKQKKIEAKVAEEIKEDIQKEEEELKNTTETIKENLENTIAKIEKQKEDTKFNKFSDFFTIVEPKNKAANILEELTKLESDKDKAKYAEDAKEEIVAYKSIIRKVVKRLAKSDKLALHNDTRNVDPFNKEGNYIESLQNLLKLLTYQDKNKELRIPVSAENVIAVAVQGFVDRYKGNTLDTRSDGEVRRILRLDQKAVVTAEDRRKVKDIAGTVSEVAKSLGKDIVSSLGIKNKKVNDINTEILIGKLEAEFGMLALKVAEESGAIVLNTKPRVQLGADRFNPEFKLGFRTPYNTIFNYDPSKKDVTVSTFSMSDRIQNTELKDKIEIARRAEVTKEAATSKTSSLGISFTKFNIVPDEVPMDKLTKILGKESKIHKDAVIAQSDAGKYFNPNFVSIFNILYKDEKFLLNLLEYEETADPTKIITKDRLPSVNGKNLGIVNGVRHLVDTLNESSKYKTKDSNYPKMYMKFKVWSNYRFGKDINFNEESGFDWQSNKLARFAVSQKETKVGIKLKSEKGFYFKLAIGQALGVKTDSQGVNAIKESSDIIDNIRNMYKEVKGDKKSLNAKERENLVKSIILEAVERGADPEHAILGTGEVLNYIAAEARGDSNFKTHIGMEVDAKTSGYVLKLLQMPFANFKEELPRGYITFQSDAKTTITKKEGLDSYEKPASVLADKLERYITDEDTNKEVEHTMFLLGETFEDGKVSISRNFMKNPFMTINYGALLNSILNVKGKVAIENTVKLLENAINGDIDTYTKLREALVYFSSPVGLDQQTKKDFNSFISLLDKVREGKVDKNILTSYEIPTTVTEVISRNVVETLREPLGKTFEEVYPELTNNITTVNEVFNAMFSLSKMKLEEKIKENLELRAKIKLKDPNKNLPEVLTTKEIEKIIRELEDILPSYRQSSSVTNTKSNRDNIALIAKLVQGQYTSMDSVNTNTINRAKLLFQDQNENITITTESKVLEENRQGGGVLTIHEIDSTLQAIILNKFDSIGIHDANVFTLDEVKKGAEYSNKATIELARRYSLPTELLNSLHKTLNSLSDSEIKGYDERLLVNELRLSINKSMPQIAKEYVLSKTDVSVLKDILHDSVEDMKEIILNNNDTKNNELIAKLAVLPRDFNIKPDVILDAVFRDIKNITSDRNKKSLAYIAENMKTLQETSEERRKEIFESDMYVEHYFAYKSGYQYKGKEYKPKKAIALKKASLLEDIKERYNNIPNNTKTMKTTLSNNLNIANPKREGNNIEVIHTKSKKELFQGIRANRDILHVVFVKDSDMQKAPVIDNVMYVPVRDNKSIKNPLAYKVQRMNKLLQSNRFKSIAIVQNNNDDLKYRMSNESFEALGNTLRKYLGITPETINISTYSDKERPRVKTKDTTKLNNMNIKKDKAIITFIEDIADKIITECKG